MPRRGCAGALPSCPHLHLLILLPSILQVHLVLVTAAQHAPLLPLVTGREGARYSCVSPPDDLSRWSSAASIGFSRSPYLVPRWQLPFCRVAVRPSRCSVIWNLLENLLKYRGAARLPPPPRQVNKMILNIPRGESGTGPPS